MRKIHKWSNPAARITESAVRATLAVIAAMAVLWLVEPQLARAQATSSLAGKPSTSPDAALNEIVVTAQKRPDTVQNLPLSITAYSGDQLLAQGITTIADVGYLTPGVSERNSGPGQTEFEMRGIASSGGQSPTVGFYLDETPLTPPADAQLGKVVVSPDLYDLDRVEVLRGPQGTLYGAGSMGGTIKIVTNQPDPSAFYGRTDLMVSGTQGADDPNYSGNVMLNIPLITDKVALRIVGTEDYTEGWIDRIVLSPFPLEINGGSTRGKVLTAPVEKDYHDVNTERTQAVRASLLVQANDQLTITPSVFYQKIDQGGLNYADSPPGVDSEAHYQPYDVSEPYSDEFTLYSLLVKYQLPGFDVTSATSDYARYTMMQEDSTEAAQNFFETVIGIPDLAYSAVGPLETTEQDDTRQFTEELRLTSNGQGPFKWIVGGFYQNFDSTSNVYTNTPGPIAVEVLGVPSLYDIHEVTDYKQYAAFGEASYKFLDYFQVTAGLRYYSYTTQEFLAESGGLPNGSLTPTDFTLPASASGYNPKFNLSYTPNGDLTVYAQAAKGFRPGSGNTPPPSSCPQDVPLQFKPDGLWSYELGEKAKLFQDRLSVNSAIYYERWTGIQQEVAQACGFTYTANAGTADVYGGEVEITGRLTPKLTLTNSMGYTHAQIVQAVPGGTFTVGEKVQDVPTWTDSTSLAYRTPVGDAYSFVARATNVFVGSMTDVSYTINEVPSHDIANLRAGLEWDRTSLSLFVDNVADTRAVLGNAAELSFNVPTFNRVATNQPRTVGINLGYKFGAR